MGARPRDWDYKPIRQLRGGRVPALRQAQGERVLTVRGELVEPQHSV